MYKYYREKSFNKNQYKYISYFLHGIPPSHLLFMKKGEKLSPILPFLLYNNEQLYIAGLWQGVSFSLSKKKHKHHKESKKLKTTSLQITYKTTMYKTPIFNTQ